MKKLYLEKIKNLRIEKGITQEDIAKIIGTSRQTYNSIESGKQDLSVTELKKITEYFNISIDSLLSGISPNIEKYKQMIIAFLRNAGDDKDNKIPKTKLAKLLYLFDFSFVYEGKDCPSGMAYRKITFGPVPDIYFSILQEMTDNESIEIENKINGDKNIYLIKEKDGNKNYKLDLLSKEEMKRVIDISKKWKKSSTSDIVRWTHNQLPYRLCRDGEIIPYSLITQEEGEQIY